MILRLPHLPIGFDPLIVDAKRRMRRRRYFVSMVVATAVLAVALTLTVGLRPFAGGDSSSNRNSAATRACVTPGWGGPGIGWRLRAGSSLSCQSALHLMRAYFGRSPAFPVVPRTVDGYACAYGIFAHSGEVRCVRGGATAIAVEDH
jgi:hypothetical protein